jgi:signal recognition particle GTPase
MVLADLGAKLTAALRKLNTTQNVDEKVVTDLLNEIAVALLSSDVNIHYIKSL